MKKIEQFIKEPANYSGGKVILVYHNEIIDAAWFKSDNLPMLLFSHNIARRLIERFVEESKKGDR